MEMSPEVQHGSCVTSLVAIVGEVCCWMSRIEVHHTVPLCRVVVTAPQTPRELHAEKAMAEHRRLLSYLFPRLCDVAISIHVAVC